VPGALPALLRLVRCCNRSKPHTSLLAEALGALRPVARDAQGAAPGLAVPPYIFSTINYTFIQIYYMSTISGGVTNSLCRCADLATASGPLMKSVDSGSPSDYTCGCCLHVLDTCWILRLADWLTGCACRRCSAHGGGCNGRAG
jgi:hypothetical protein